MDIYKWNTLIYNNYLNLLVYLFSSNLNETKLILLIIRSIMFENFEKKLDIDSVILRLTKA